MLWANYCSKINMCPPQWNPKAKTNFALSDPLSTLPISTNR